MKPSARAYRFFASFLLASALSLGTVFCLISAFSIPVNAVPVLWAGLIAALCFSLSLLPDRIWLFLLSLAAAGGLGWHFRGAVAGGALSAAQKAAEMYISGFSGLLGREVHLPVPENADAAFVFIALAVLLAAVTAFSVSRGSSPVPPVLVSLPFLLACLVMNTTVPDKLPLFVLAGSWTVLILSAALMRRSAGKRHLLTLLLMLPTAGLILILSLILRAGNYTQPGFAQSMQERLLEFESSNAFLKRFTAPNVQPSLGGQGWNSDPSCSDLSSAGPQRDSRRHVMDVWSGSSDFLYLRGSAYTLYDGGSWTQIPKESYLAQIPKGESLDLVWLPMEGADGSRYKLETQEVRIRTDSISNLFYLPPVPESLPGGSEYVFDTAVSNPARLKEYTVPYQKKTPLTDSVTTGLLSFPFYQGWYQQFVYDNYLQVPQTTRKALAAEAELVLQNIMGYYFPEPIHTSTLEDSVVPGYTIADAFPWLWSDHFIYTGEEEPFPYEWAYDSPPPVLSRETDPTEMDLLLPILFRPKYESRSVIAQIAADYVRTAARYSKNTPLMPEGEDFVSWFLHESDTGYCIHFASATVILLRCLGIPARFVTGFAVSPKPEQWTPVTQNEAHAWVEYYTSDLGWCVLDPTPAGSTPSQFEPIVHTQPSDEDGEDPADPSQESPVPRESIERSTEEPSSSAAEVPENDTPGLFSRILRAAGFTVLGLIAAALTVRLVSVLLRRRRLGATNINERTLACYRELKLCLNDLREVPHKTLTELAEKARFSQHIITKKEAAAMREAAEKARERLLNESDPLHRLWLRLFRGL